MIDAEERNDADAEEAKGESSAQLPSDNVPEEDEISEAIIDIYRTLDKEADRYLNLEINEHNLNLQIIGILLAFVSLITVQLHISFSVPFVASLMFVLSIIISVYALIFGKMKIDSRKGYLECQARVLDALNGSENIDSFTSIAVLMNIQAVKLRSINQYANTNFGLRLHITSIVVYFVIGIIYVAVAQYLI